MIDMENLDRQLVLRKLEHHRSVVITCNDKDVHNLLMHLLTD